GQRIAAARLEVSEADVEFVGTRFAVKVTEGSIGLFEAACRIGAAFEAGFIRRRFAACGAVWLERAPAEHPRAGGSCPRPSRRDTRSTSARRKAFASAVS